MFWFSWRKALAAPFTYGEAPSRTRAYEKFVQLPASRQKAVLDKLLDYIESPRYFKQLENWRLLQFVENAGHVGVASRLRAIIEPVIAGRQSEKQETQNFHANVAAALATCIPPDERDFLYESVVADGCPPAVRLAFCRGLRRLRDTRATEHFIRLATDNDYQAVRNAIPALGALGDRRASGTLAGC
jgi:hypothetical protein